MATKGRKPGSDNSHAAASRARVSSAIGPRLRQAREHKNMSVRGLARYVGVSPSLVSQIELDRVNPSVSTLYGLVTELGMTMSDVFGDSRPPVVPQAGTGDGLAERPETRRVINLASDKAAVFGEIASVLKPGGRVGVTDIVADERWRDGISDSLLRLSGGLEKVEISWPTSLRL